MIDGRPLIYMVHPVRGHDGDVPGNLVKAKEFLGRLLAANPGKCLIAPWITECEIFDDSDPEQRAIGLARCLGVIGHCSEVWVCGPYIGEGMRMEMDYAESLGIKVVML